MIKKIPVFALFFLLGAFISIGQEVKLKAEEISSSLTYTMKNPLHSWSGDSNGFDCEIAFNKTSLKVISVTSAAKIVSFDTNIKLRNKNAFKLLEDSLFPTVSFVSEDITDEGNSVTINGLLTFHGVTKEIKISAVKTLINSQLCIRGSFSIKLTDFDLSPPSLLGIKAEDNIDLKFTMNFVVK